MIMCVFDCGCDCDDVFVRSMVCVGVGLCVMVFLRVCVFCGCDDMCVMVYVSFCMC